MNLSQQQKIFSIFFVSVIFHLLACYSSTGFHNFDEHFQIIEFANLKLGHISGADLPWEYSAKARPFFQPMIYYGITKALYSIGVENPFTIVFLFRLLSLVLGMTASWVLYRCGCRWFSSPREQIVVAVFTFGLWFLPYLHVRTSSEVMSSAFFIFGLGTLILGSKKHFVKFLLAGLFFGLALNCRYHVGLMVASVVLWAYWYGHARVRHLIALSVVTGVFFSLGLVLDFWGYGEWNFTPWQYFKADFIHGMLADDGLEPWWYYLKSLTVILPPLSFLISAAAIAGMFLQLDHVLTWICLPFLLFHSMVGHKELRYLFPMVSLAPLMSIYAWSRFPLLQRVFKNHAVLVFLAVVNILTLINLSISPAKREIALYQFAYSASPTNFEYVAMGEDPFFPSGLRPWFYTRNTKRIAHTETFGEFSSLIENGSAFGDRNKFYFVMPASMSSVPSQIPCVEVWDNVPLHLRTEFLLRQWNRFKVRSWIVYECSTRRSAGGANTRDGDHDSAINPAESSRVLKKSI